jgi:hypothetical protein
MFDFFVGTGLEEHLRASGIEKIVLAGLTSQTCIEGTGRHALEAGFPRYVPDGRRRGFHGRSASGGSRVIAEQRNVGSPVQIAADLGLKQEDV